MSARHLALVQFSARRDGSAMSALLLADGLAEAGWTVTVLFASDGPMIEVFEHHGHVTKVIPHKNWLRATTVRGTLRNWARERAAIRQFRERLAVLKPTVVYVNTGASAAAVRAARTLRQPVIWHLRELFDDVGGELVVPDAMRGMIRRAFIRWSDRLVVNSKAVGANLLGEAARQAGVVYNAVDDRFFEEARSAEEARATLGLPVGPTLIGVPGTLRPMKGHPFFFEAVAPLLQSDPSLLVAVTGRGEKGYEEHLHALGRQLGIEDRIHFLGSIDDMPAFYRACDVACVPSRAEPFGRTVIEAFAVGVPVLATRVGGIPEILDDTVTGRLAEYGDAAAFGCILRDLLADPAQRARVQAHARQHAERHYRSTVYTARLLPMVEETAGV